VSAPAKAGIIAPNDVLVPKGNTGMEPTQTSFLQALNIPSKINKGQVEILSDVNLIKVRFFNVQTSRGGALYIQKPAECRQIGQKRK